ncbi:MAG: hypothetical protein A2V66_06720 [Ignavibacteria bacterium RBG_13_36_8]|nr:MAG: hypothetical protein A2V66_06720 [Ignavibacteria bacterium RBG_13_36_8]
MQLTKYSFGVGDRFAHQGKAQLMAIKKAKENGVIITPVWNKSFREHQIIKSHPIDTRKEADLAVRALGWNYPYFVDADHVNLNSVDTFIESCDFFTIDVADYIRVDPNEKDLAEFISRNKSFIGELELCDLSIKLIITENKIKEIGKKYLYAIKQAKKIYQRILESKGENNFVVEISMDETEFPQSPLELFLILSAVAEEGIPAQTIAPKFSGRFNKGIDYAGDVQLFKNEFELDLAVLKQAVKLFSLPKNLKLSIHSGSDKFSIYPSIKELVKKYDAGLHIKTAGTTWLEELIGLAAAGGEGLVIAKEIYQKAFDRYDELCGPYKSVIDINLIKLPLPEEVDKWSSDKFSSTLRHDQSCEDYNPHFRQLLHVSYKIAVEFGKRFVDSLQKYEGIIAGNVIDNLYERHIRKIFF